MELTNFDIIKGPVVSDKAYRLNKDNSKLVIEVHNKATKKMVKDAIEQLFDVKVAAVNTTIRKKCYARVASKRHNARPTISKRKIAYVTLAEGYELNLFDQAGKTSMQTERTTQKTMAS